MVLNYRGSPPFRKPVQTLVDVYAKPSASETTLKQLRRFMYVLDTDNVDSVREIMDKSGLTENTDWRLVRWEDEGLPDPDTWSKYVVKVLIRAGESKDIIVPTVPYTCTIFVKVYGSANITVQITTTGIGDIQYSTPTIKLQSAWAVISATASWHPRYFPRNFKVTITNTGTSDEYVYIAEINVISLINDKVITEIPLANMRGGLIEATNTTITIQSTLGISGKGYVQIATVVKSDGTNPVTVDVYVDGRKYSVHVGSLSTTSTSYVALLVYLPIDVKTFNTDLQTHNRVRIVVSSAGLISISEYFVLIQAVGSEHEERYKRVSGSYTSDGDGTTDTVTILEYTSNVKRIGRLLRIKATGDANTTQLQLQVDGEVVWDFLNDGDTCTLELNDLYKVELLVNDPGGGTTTTVNYVVQYSEKEGIAT